MASATTPAESAGRAESARFWRLTAGRGLLFAATLAVAVPFLIPFLWMISASLKALPQVFTIPIQWLPDPIYWSNYPTALSRLPFGLFYRNTVLIASITTLGNVISSSLVGYGFARFRFPARDALFVLVLGTMMLPYQVTLIPLYVLYRELGWIDSWRPLIVPAYFGSAFYIFLLRQFFMTVPAELDDAARIDGAGALRIYWHILLPLSRPALATVTILTFLGEWNDFLAPLIYLHSTEIKTVALGLRMFQEEALSEVHLLMAASVVSMLPPLALFFGFQRYFVRGIALTGIKG